MSYLIFDWDHKKNRANLSKHGVGFGEAKSCFFDPMHILLIDQDHSSNEERLILLGMSEKSRLLVVVHSEVNEGVIRIVSARKATKTERRAYEEV